MVFIDICMKKSVVSIVLIVSEVCESSLMIDGNIFIYVRSNYMFMNDVERLLRIVC